MEGESSRYLNYMLDSDDDLIRKKKQLLGFNNYWSNRIESIKRMIKKASKSIKVIDDILELRKEKDENTRE